MDLFFLTEGDQFTLYSLEMGESVTNFINNLSRTNENEHARVIRRLEQLAERGPSKKKTEFNNLGNGLFETKTRGGARVIFFYDQDSIVICAYGFVKKSNKTPKKVFETAQERKRQYDKHKSAHKPFTIQIPDDTEQPRRMP
jgi:phage-related protein